MKNVLDILTFTLVAVFVFSWVYTLFNGRSSSPSSWGEYYESAGR